MDDHQSGRWLVGGSVGENSAWAFVESWATNPGLVPVVSAASVWKVFGEDSGDWRQDPELRVECRERDATLYVFGPPTTAGMYSLTGAVVDERPAYIHSGGELYLYARLSEDGGRLWIIGEHLGDGAGLAFVQESAADDEGRQHPPVGASQDWRVPVDGEWVAAAEPMGVITADGDGGQHAHETIWETLRNIRLTPKLTEAVEGAYARLSNGVAVPLVGFGAGATAREESEEAVRNALVAGYRSLDGATAYDNDDVIGGLLASDAAPVTREQVFVTGKLWYDELGFEPSLRAAASSRWLLRTDYHDVLLLHWPQCYDDVVWMDCDAVPEGVGTWKESWRALERLYAEGAALAIGVSNFDARLLHELAGLASTMPHVIQNHRDVLFQDEQTIAVAQSYGLWYQAYSSLRGLLDAHNPQYDHARRVLAAIGDRHGGKSVAQVALRWEVQQGHGVIPRSFDPAHLHENLAGVLDWALDDEAMAEIEALSVRAGEGAREEL